MNTRALIVALAFSLSPACSLETPTGSPFPGPKPELKSAPAPAHIQPGVQPYNALCRQPGVSICQSTA